MTTKTPEPAIKSYFFGKGYRDLVATIKDSFNRNLQSAGKFFNAVGTGSGPMYTLKRVFYIGAGIATFVFGTAVFVAASAFHVALLLSFLALIYVLFSLLYLAERLYLSIKSFFLACPSCHAKHSIPEYLCDGCGAVHSRLIPNSYGILWHVCECGRRLPATFFLNRGRLQARCPSCHELVEREHVESKRLFIPVIGGPHSGKSAFLYSALHQYVDVAGPALGYVVSPLDAASKTVVDSAISQLNGGYVPNKTITGVPRAVNLALHRDGRLEKVLYFYDPAGETFDRSDSLIALGCNKYLSGMLLVVDPFSIPAVLAEYEGVSMKDVAGLSPGEHHVEDIIQHLLLVLESDYGLAHGATVKVPLAIVVSKIDAFNLRDLVGEPAVQKAIKASVAGVDPAAMRNRVIRQQLLDWGATAFVHTIDSRFGEVMYFASSALGRIPDSSGNPYVGEGVIEPLSWVLDASEAASAPIQFVGNKNGRSN